MSFELYFSSKAEKQIKKLPEKIKQKIKVACLKISEDPYLKGSIKVEGQKNMRRLRVGRFRILYIVLGKKKEVLIVKIERRTEETYKF